MTFVVGRSLAEDMPGAARGRKNRVVITMAEGSQPDMLKKAGSASLKTALIVLGANVLLAGFKFAVYWVSGSLAVLAEAWHSFTDIATSGLVFLAILVSNKKGSVPDTEDSSSSSSSSSTRPRAVSFLEIGASVCIGLLLLAVSLLLFMKLAGPHTTMIQNPVLSGLAFIVFALGSYLISTFETQMGKSQASIGLISDGMHARADMLASLLTGVSLLVYAMGVNIDRWMAGAVAVIILLLSVDTFVNAFQVVRDKNGNSLYAYRFLSATFSVFSIKNLKRLPCALHGCLLNRIKDPGKVTRLYTSLLVLPVAALLVFYGSTACYCVAPDQTAVVERFGKPVTANCPVGPGFHLKMPWPVDRVVKVASRRIRELDIGNNGASESGALIWTVQHGNQETFLTGDNNFFYPYIILHYRIKDVSAYLYNHCDPRQLLNEIGHQSAVSLFAGHAFYDIATAGRDMLQERMKQEVQKRLDLHESGIELVSVNFKDIHPPISIAKSFEQVIAAFQTKQKEINQAVGYANQVFPQSRANAQKEIEEAAGYSAQRLSEAQGRAKRFEMQLPATQVQRQISKEQIYRDTMKAALQTATKIIVDPRAGTPDIWMDFDMNASPFSEYESRADRTQDRPEPNGQVTPNDGVR